MSWSDLRASPPAFTVTVPPAIVRESLPRRPSSEAVALIVPLRTYRSSLEVIASEVLEVTLRVPEPVIVRSMSG